MELSLEQSDALRDVINWFKFESKTRKVFRVFGFAGTGKSTLARYFAEGIRGTVLYAAFTGKAALVMQQAGCYGAQTLHSLIYRPKVDKKTGKVTFVLNYESPLADAKLLIVDECSMVDEELAKHVLSFGVPILVLGDPMQLPPVKGQGFFTEALPDVMLTEIHRQAADNPIIQLATAVREGKRLAEGVFGTSKVVSGVKKTDALEADQIIVGRNQTRDTINARMRALHGYDGVFPMDGDKLICLKNDKDLGMFNGGIFKAVKNSWTREGKSDMNFHYLDIVEDEDKSRKCVVRVHDSCFDKKMEKPDWRLVKGSQEFDYGYAITAHKSQGSQWPNVMIYDESYCFRDDAKRWMYTAVTRASDRVTIVLT